MAEENKDCESSSLLLSLNNLGADRQNNRSICPDLTGCKIWSRRVKNKGSILVLILSYLMSSSLYLYTEYDPHMYWLVPFSITIAISGWLADACIGRYKMISCGVWTAWLLTVAATVSAVVGQFSGHQHTKKIEITLFCLLINSYFILTP